MSATWTNSDCATLWATSRFPALCDSFYTMWIGTCVTYANVNVTDTYSKDFKAFGSRLFLYTGWRIPQCALCSKLT